MSRRFRPYLAREGAGPTVVLVHGGWIDRRTWDLLVPYLTSQHEVVRYDRRGHSRSPWVGPVPRRQDEDDLASLLELFASPAHVVANSYGASIALGLASRRPELMASLAVHEPPLLGVGRPGTDLYLARPAVLAQLDQVASEIRRGRPEDGARRFVEEVALGPGWWALLPLDVQATMVANAHTFVGMLADPGWDGLAMAPPPSLPLLLSDGAASPAMFHQITAALAALVPHARLLRIAGAGHVPHTTHPAEYAAALTHFITTATTTEVLS
jgi:pimeloyl-ACP methyl ester carboxylesterase